MAPTPNITIRRVLPPETTLSPLGQVTQLGWLDYHAAPPPWLGYRTFGRFALVYVLRGEGQYEDARGTHQAVEAGDAIVVFPDLPHRYRPGPRGWSEVFLVFDGPIFDAWLQTGVLSHDRPILRLTPVDHWRQRIEAVLIEQTDPLTTGCGASSDAIVEVCRTQQLLGDALAAQQQPSGDAWLAQAQAALAANTPPMQVARQLHMSYAAFRRRFTAHVGVSPGRYRTQRLIDRACEMIASGRLSDKQIAAELGFCDAHHFSKRFKAITGQTPTAFRHALPFGGKLTA